MKGEHPHLLMLGNKGMAGGPCIIDDFWRVMIRGQAEAIFQQLRCPPKDATPAPHTTMPEASSVPVVTKTVSQQVDMLGIIAITNPHLTVCW